ncbi:unnamed protein product [Brassica oleracea]|uniref:Uncharacterized protein n=2 Tax=Brassica TaxID=3705 RepID=A0A3P6EIZ2_BRAOL|nr:unnamed protein product [Brassica napus]VDD44447.1 unnamed protein product [Brassica oleracea]
MAYWALMEPIYNVGPLRAKFNLALLPRVVENAGPSVSNGSQIGLVWKIDVESTREEGKRLTLRETVVEKVVQACVMKMELNGSLGFVIA